ncbi:MAG: hypothetical protein AB1798_12925 [Spirochaetota bacterium]
MSALFRRRRTPGAARVLRFCLPEAKENAFKELLEQYLDALSAALAEVKGKTVNERLKQFINIVASQVRHNVKLVNVHRIKTCALQ